MRRGKKYFTKKNLRGEGGSVVDNLMNLLILYIAFWGIGFWKGGFSSVRDKDKVLCEEGVKNEKLFLNHSSGTRNIGRRRYLASGHR